MSIPSTSPSAELAATADFFEPGNQFFIGATLDPRVESFLGRAMVTIVAEDQVGVLAQLSATGGEPSAQLVFVPFAEDGSTVFNRVQRGAYRYVVADGNSPVLDLGDGSSRPVSEFYEPFVADLQRMSAEAATARSDGWTAGAVVFDPYWW